MITTWAGFTRFGLPHPVAGGLAVLFFGFILIPTLERVIPYRQEWRSGTGDTRVDVAHLPINNGVVEKLLAALLTVALVGSTAWLSVALGMTPWPHHWPLLLQFLLMAVVAEFGSYWYHYLAHKTPWMWRFHAIHHSPSRLYFLNAPRFHPVDRVISNLPEMFPFILLGANIEVITLFFTYNAITGLCQHCDVRLKPLSPSGSC